MLPLYMCSNSKEPTTPASPCTFILNALRLDPVCQEWEVDISVCRLVFTLHPLVDFVSVFGL